MKVNFDYVIVGAGCAGCVLAARLSEDPDVTVALVAGDRDIGSGTGVPLDGSGWREIDFDADLTSEPEPALRRRRIHLRGGGGLGGASSIDGMAYVRGNRADFDEWSRHGAAGWSYDEMLPYFIKSAASAFHGDDLHGGNERAAGIVEIREDDEACVGRKGALEFIKVDGEIGFKPARKAFHTRAEIFSDVEQGAIRGLLEKKFVAGFENGGHG